MASDTRNLTDARAPYGADGAAAPAAAPERVRGPGPAAREADERGSSHAAPSRVALPDAAGPRDVRARLTAHGCWYPSADPAGARVAFICDRGGVPQLWAGPVDGAVV